MYMGCLAKLDPPAMTKLILIIAGGFNLFVNAFHCPASRFFSHQIREQKSVIIKDKTQKNVMPVTDFIFSKWYAHFAK